MEHTRLSVGLSPLTARVKAACLVEICGPDLGRTYVLEEHETSIGRAAECSVSLDMDSVSRRHSRIRSTPPVFVICDDGSTNGTFVNDRRIQAETELRSGDLIRVGSAVFKFLSDDASSGLEAQYHEAIYRLTITD